MLSFQLIRFAAMVIADDFDQLNFNSCLDGDCKYYSTLQFSNIINFIFILFLFSSIFILLSRESDQCAIRARLGVAGHLSTTPRWGNPAKCLSQRHNK